MRVFSGDNMKRRGAQIVEEGLLIIIALMAIGITIGAANTIYAKIEEMIQSLFDTLNWWWDTLFPFL